MPSLPSAAPQSDLAACDVASSDRDRRVPWSGVSLAASAFARGRAWAVGSRSGVRFGQDVHVNVIHLPSPSWSAPELAIRTDRAVRLARRDALRGHSEPAPAARP